MTSLTPLARAVLTVSAQHPDLNAEQVAEQVARTEGHCSASTVYATWSRHGINRYSQPGVASPTHAALAAAIQADDEDALAAATEAARIQATADLETDFDFDQWVDHAHEWPLEGTVFEGKDLDDVRNMVEAAREVAEDEMFRDRDSETLEDQEAADTRRAAAQEVLAAWNECPMDEACLADNGDCWCVTDQWQSFDECSSEHLGTLAAANPDHSWIDDDGKEVDITSSSLISDLDQSDYTALGDGFKIAVDPSGDVSVHHADLRMVPAVYTQLATSFEEHGTSSFSAGWFADSLEPDMAEVAANWLHTEEDAEALISAIDRFPANGTAEDLIALADVYHYAHADSESYDDLPLADIRAIAVHVDELAIVGEWAERFMPSGPVARSVAGLVDRGFFTAAEARVRATELVEKHDLDYDAAYAGVIAGAV